MNRNNETTETFSKLWVTAMITLTMMLPVNVACSQTKQQVPQQSVKTIYPTKDWAISDFVVTAPEFGAKAEPGFDNRAAFQAAIDAAYQSGGGVVYIPAGNYEFRSTQVGTKNVRVRQGHSETKIFILSMFCVSTLVCSFVVIGLIRHPIMGKSLEQFSKYVSVKTHRITMEVLKAGGTTARQIMRFVPPIPV